jgi:hypothetical protein
MGRGSSAKRASFHFETLSFRFETLLNQPCEGRSFPDFALANEWLALY